MPINLIYYAIRVVDAARILHKKERDPMANMFLLHIVTFLSSLWSGSGGGVSSTKFDFDTVLSRLEMGLGSASA